MSLEQWSAIAQILASFVGIPSLIFVGVQVNLMTKTVKATSSQAHSAMYQSLSAAIVDNSTGFAKPSAANFTALDGRLTCDESPTVRLYTELVEAVFEILKIVFNLRETISRFGIGQAHCAPVLGLVRGFGKRAHMAKVVLGDRDRALLPVERLVEVGERIALP